MRGVPRRQAPAGLYRSSAKHPAVWQQRQAERARDAPRRLYPAPPAWRHARLGTPWSQLRGQ